MVINMAEAYPTPHINACPEDFAKTVLMPGDPLRAKFISETYLENPRLITSVRGMLGYTGSYRGRPVSVMGSGMGMPSMGIYAYELFNIFGVENIIRLGTAGGISDKVRLRDMIIAMAACTDSSFSASYNLPGTYAPIGSWPLLRVCAGLAESSDVNCSVGNILTTDVFYADSDSDDNNAAPEPFGIKWAKMSVLAVDMETAALYMTAARAGKNALSLLTVSNHLKTGEAISAGEREKDLCQMIELGLECAWQI